MTFILRIMLIAVSILTMNWVVKRIRKSQMRIEDSLFWIIFSLFLVLISLFPKIIHFGARLTGVQSDVNFLFLLIIFILIVQMFRMSITISQLTSKVDKIAQSIAVKELEAENEKKESKSIEK